MRPVDMSLRAFIKPFGSLRARKARNMAKDKHGRDVFLAGTAWDLNSTQDLFPEVQFHFTSEF